MGIAREYGGGKPVLSAAFEGATFQGAVDFSKATFRDTADFREAIFEGAAHFKDVTFEDEARFEAVTFTREAHFADAIFEGAARFRDAVFGGYAHFPTAPDGDRAKSAMFKALAEFVGADLKAGLRLGPALVLEELVLDNASLGDVDMRVSGCRLSCRRTRFHDPAHLNVRWANIELEDAVFDRPSTLAFLSSWDGPSEAALRCYQEEGEPGAVALRRRRDRTPARPRGMPRLVSLSGADVGDLTLADIDLSSCVFESALRLDGMRLATVCPFDAAPSGQRFTGRSFPLLWVWTKRMTIREERRWRASTPKRDGWADDSVTECVVRARLPGEAERLAKIYRALRKGREDEGNAPGAGDFYYGEMEMRRRGQGSRAERMLISAYWLVSGYGLRASRSLAALAITVAAFTVALYLFGLKSRGVGTALLQAVEAATLRSGDSEVLTEGGKALQVALRLLGPLLFGLALFSLRGRVKR
jgi:uncharacterized protein YjbI with pentapeptide repeats